MLTGAARTYAQSMRSYRISRRELIELQSRKLRRTVRLAYESVPFYREWFKTSGRTPEEVRGVEDIRILPTLEKSDLVGRPLTDFVARDMWHTFSRYERTTGTTGQPLRLAWSAEWEELDLAMNLRRLTVLGMGPWNRVLTIWPPLHTWAKPRDAERMGRPPTEALGFPFSLFGRPLPPLRTMACTPGEALGDALRLRSMKPDWVFSRPSILRRMGRLLKKQGLEVKLKGIFCTNEVFTQTCARELEALFQAPTYWGYGAREAGRIGTVCRARRGLHLNEDFTIFEVLRDGEPVGPGEYGELVATVLHNPVSPLLRYRLGDTVELADAGTCGCGSNLARLKSVQGRAEDWLLTEGGGRARPLPVAEYIESTFGLADYQLVQLDVARFVLRLWDERVGGEVVDELRRHLATVVGAPVELSVESRPEKELWAKSRPVVCRVAGA